MDKFRPDTFLPLTPVAFEILIALADGERHGYSILQEVESRSGGTIALHAGTLYRALARLLESDLIGELNESPDPSSADRGSPIRLGGTVRSTTHTFALGSTQRTPASSGSTRRMASSVVSWADATVGMPSRS